MSGIGLRRERFAIVTEASNSQRDAVLAGVRQEYARRTERYDRFTPHEQRMFDLLMSRRHRQYERLFRDHGLLPLGTRQILDVGSGRNEWLAACRTQWGQTGEGLCGMELLPERVAQGRATFPYLKLECGSADQLPWPDEQFDLIHQGMLLSSILDEALSRRIVAEMARVTRPGGYAVWYDFVWNPGNRAARGISIAQVRDYFPGWELVEHRRVTLAPPVARILARVSERLIDLAEALRVLNFWELALLRKPGAA
jgi:SAM-dependent methyltransferase